MATVYLGIGFPKTGSTAVQTFLRENQQLLEKKGYCFPDFTGVIGDGNRYRDRNGHFLAYNAGSLKLRDEAAIRGRALRELGRLAGKFPNIILSDELLCKSSVRRENFWTNVLEDFHKLGCELKVIVYLRRQDLFIESLWNERVKSKHFETQSFTEYLEDGKVFEWPLDYYEFLKKTEKYINRENLIVRVYEKKQFEKEGHSIFSDFLQCTGLELTDEYTKETVKKNLGLRGNFIEIKRIINSLPQYRELEDFMKGPVIAASASAQQDSLHAAVTMFSREQQEQLLQKYEESNRKTAEIYLDRPDGKLFYDSVEGVPVWEADSENMYGDIIRVMGEALCQQQEEIRRLKSDPFFKVYQKLNNRLKRE